MPQGDPEKNNQLYLKMEELAPKSPSPPPRSSSMCNSRIVVVSTSSNQVTSSDPSVDKQPDPSLQKKHGHRHKMDEEEVSCRDIEALAPMLPVELARAPDLVANTARPSAGTSKQGLQQHSFYERRWIIALHRHYALCFLM
ncbi:uncharacterized protein [Aegilops tauschii subsp. strangulata]|uniref:uncharacterized protein n=1 Tax=Aegilops tauschii subsp. strangulata TaxID=200361 RepID=UPI00098BB488|nr:uncharacterized protein LOC109778872 [Aegilops tauschii subsp. strangulata]